MRALPANQGNSWFIPPFHISPLVAISLFSIAIRLFLVLQISSFVSFFKIRFHIWVIKVILNVATLNKQKETNNINLNNIFDLTQHVPNFNMYSVSKPLTWCSSTFLCYNFEIRLQSVSVRTSYISITWSSHVVTEFDSAGLEQRNSDHTLFLYQFPHWIPPT